MKPYRWVRVGDFRDRRAELERLEAWWRSDDRGLLNVHGRRRVGKTWLLRRFAHGKPALVLVAERRAPGDQLARFASELEPLLGLRPDLPDLPALLRALYRLGRDRRVLVVLDEFPWLLPTTEAEVERVLSALQATYEEEADASRLKLVLCGSSVARMESLQGERNPLHGRLRAVPVTPMAFPAARSLMAGPLSPQGQIERYAVCGGMPLYLDLLARRHSLERAVCDGVLSPLAPLWNEARVVLEQELRQPATYFSLLEQLASGDKTLDEVASGARVENTTVSKYLATLSELRIVERRLPVGARPSARGGHWRLADPFLRFWFRFVFPYQADLEAGLRPGDLWRDTVAPALADHVAPAFEELCRRWARVAFGARAARVGSWWGRARDDLRREGRRSSEEIDVVGLGTGRRVTLVGECRWRSRAMGAEVLADLVAYKLPALAQDGYERVGGAQVVLFSRQGFTAGLVEAAEGRNVRLVPAEEVVRDLTAEGG